jgi:hypothetical protein
MWTLFSVIASNFYNLAYFFMILSMYWNAGLISLGYPIAVFGYALIEETRPGKKFWTIMIVYTMMILITKFVLQLPFWKETKVDAIFSYSNWLNLGLKVIEDPIDQMYYMLPEIFIIATIMFNNIYINLIGLEKESEPQIE